MLKCRLVKSLEFFVASIVILIHNSFVLKVLLPGHC